jgi:hypothetical protein
LWQVGPEALGAPTYNGYKPNYGVLGSILAGLGSDSTRFEGSSSLDSC